MDRKNKRRTPMPNTGSEEIPPGATRHASDWPGNMGNDDDDMSPGPRHAAADPGNDAVESYGPADSNQPLADEPGTVENEGANDGDNPPYSGISGGAVGGTPAQKRSKGGRTHRGIAPGSNHRGDSTVGSDPDEPTD